MARKKARNKDIGDESTEKKSNKDIGGESTRKKSNKMTRRKARNKDIGGESIKKKKTLKKQIRDIKRLLTKDDLPETVRLTKERIFKSLQDELNDKATLKQIQKLSKKYRMVKFFDKRKVVRKLSSLCKKYQTDDLEDSEKSSLLGEVCHLRRELNYIVHFPPGEKYIALYPSSTPSSETALTKQRRLLESVMTSVESGDLPDAATLEKDITLPTDLDMFGVCDRLEPSTVASSFKHEEPVAERTRSKSAKKMATKKERMAAHYCEEGDNGSQTVESGRDKLRQDGFFLMDTDS